MSTPEFKLVAGHPSLDFVNTLDNRFSPDGPTDLLNSYADLLRFTGQARLIDPAVIASIAAIQLEDLELQAFERAFVLRETLARLHYGRLDSEPPSDDDLSQLNEFEKAIAQRRQLVPSAGGFEWKWIEPEYDVSLPVWALATSASSLLLSPSDMSFVRACECVTCRWLFLDSSRNRARRWCDMKLCGNRMKARRFQNRHSGT